MGAYADRIVADGASHYWRLNEASGTTAADSVGAAPGTIGATGVTYGVAGPLADGTTALTFDGASGQISTPNITLVAPLTCELWFKATPAGQNNFFGQFSFPWGPSAVDDDAFICYLISGHLEMYIALRDGAAYGTPPIGSGLENGAWHHFVVVFHGPNAEVFLDGVSAIAGALPYAGFTNRPMQIGWYAAGPTYFAGSLDEVAVYPLALTATQIAEHYALRTATEPEPELPSLTVTPRLAVELASGTWTDLTPDVIASAGIRTTRGIAGSGPMDRVAIPGVLTFTLRNDAGNSGHTLGWYSPDHVAVRAGWTPGIPVKLELDYNEAPYPLWTGRVRTIAPEPGRYLSRYVEVTCHDVIGDLTETVIREIPPQINQTEDALIEAVVDALSATVQPPLDLDAGLDELPFVFDDLGEGAPALQLVTDVMTSTFGMLFVAADGTLVYRNRQSQNVVDVLGTFADPNLLNDGGLDLQAGLASVYNRVRATVHPRSLGATNTAVLFAATGAIKVPPSGGTVTIWGTYADPTNTTQTIGGMDFQIPLVAGTDYQANTQANGTGVDITADVSIVATPFASGVEFTITNAHIFHAYLVTPAGEPHLQLRGRAIADNAPLTVESVSAQPYGDRPLTIDLKYQDDAEVAQNLVDFIQPLYNTASRRVERLGFNPQQSETQLLAALEREIGDVVSVSETVTGIESVPVAIRGVEWEIQPARPAFARVWWTVAPALVIGPAWMLDDAVQSILDETTVLGWG